MTGPCVAVGYSGGRDSTALLHATLTAARPLGMRVIALHVHHGLNLRADEWVDHCRVQCERWREAGHEIEFAHERISTSPARGESVEAWARVARYRALREMATARGARVVLLAHHRADHAETFLLQALRGGGVAGMAAMPREVTRDGVTWVRPWLARSRKDIDAYVGAHGLLHIDDDSNRDVRFARSRIRTQVWPSLEQAFPAAEASLVQAAKWAHEASECLAELALIDLGHIADGGALNIEAWMRLSAARRSNSLRAWFRRETGAAPGASLTGRLLDELPAFRPARWPLHSGELRSYRGALRFEPVATDNAAGGMREATVQVSTPGEYRLPGWGGALVARSVAAKGAALATLQHLDLRPRRGGEQFQLDPSRPPRSLKKQYQAAGVAEWCRRGPVVYDADRLVFVPGLGVDAGAFAVPGEAQMTLEWVPASREAS